jgi:hypothetical protein
MFYHDAMKAELRNDAHMALHTALSESSRLLRLSRETDCSGCIALHTLQAQKGTYLASFFDSLA